jgi:RNA 2',3'-cyclic 3'-phosphodiesterase
MRLFIALDIDDATRAHITRFLDGIHEFVPDARWVKPESLHITLKFIGEQSEEKVEAIKRALETITGKMVELNIRGYGFFPTSRMPRVFWIGIDPGNELTALAAAVDEKLSVLGIRKEEHAFSPHLTLARGGAKSGSPRKQRDDRANGNFQRLQEKLAALPPLEFGTMTAREFFLYQSQLSPGGSRYTKLAGFALH